MAKVKILLEKDESELDAQIAIQKALDIHTKGDTHKESFEDPAMVHTIQYMEELHEKTYKAMMQEIMEELDEEYS